MVSSVYGSNNINQVYYPGQYTMPRYTAPQYPSILWSACKYAAWKLYHGCSIASSAQYTSAQNLVRTPNNDTFQKTDNKTNAASIKTQTHTPHFAAPKPTRPSLAYFL